jgi:hypothetical protein
MQLPVLKIHICLTIHAIGFVNQLSHRDMNAAVLLQFMLTMQTPICCTSLTNSFIEGVCNLAQLSSTRWFKYDRDWFVCKQAAQVPVIFEPPCSCSSAGVCCIFCPVSNWTCCFKVFHIFQKYYCVLNMAHHEAVTEFMTVLLVGFLFTIYVIQKH